jgi:hypothetical protein
VTAGRRLGDTGGDARRAILGVVAWILILLAGYWLVTDWPALSRVATDLLSSLH